MTFGQVLAIIYADIFDYPLKMEEIEKWEIKDRNSKFQILNSNLIKKKGKYFFLKGREEIIDLRKKKEKYARKKLKIAKKIANLLRIIPTIKMVAVTGALAMRNADKEDDIDFFIVTSSKKLWLTRFFTTLFVELTGKRRRPKDKEIRDKICLNMFLDEDHLRIPAEERNLYTAHEVAQLMPLWERNNTYIRFLDENEWVKGYLPNAVTQKGTEKETERHRIGLKNLGVIPELLLKHLQLWYMKKKRTKELISDGRVKFHPEDKTEWVIKEYNKRIKRGDI